jgi:lipopolysaccharide biosynthesis glycosyltransferase
VTSQSSDDGTETTLSGAVCYIATDGYLFQTVVSALQARRHTEAPVYVCHLGSPSSAEVDLFASISEENGVQFSSTPRELIEGQHPVFARFYVDQLLPATVDHALYLDGDTQVVGDLNPLLELESPGRILAARDPMVLIEKVHPALSRKINTWWDTAGIASETRADYVNAGVMRLPLGALSQVRADVLRLTSSGRTLPFSDQDAVNILCHDSIDVLSTAWNFPGFLLGTPIARATQPRIIHFMSSPRPWSAALPPWGEEYFAPYASLVDRYPRAAGHWERFSLSQQVRYRAQHAYKYLTERRAYVDAATLRTYEEQERSALLT